MKTLLVLVALLAFSGTGSAQPPTAPPPREGESKIHNLKWTYTGPKLEIEAKDGKVEVRWTSDGKVYAASGAKVGVRDGVVSVAGTEKEPARLMSAGMQLSGLRIDISIDAGTFEVLGAGLIRQR